MRYDFVFDKTRVMQFDLTESDIEHVQKHRTRMQEWNGPIMMDALSGVDWDEVQRNYPFYSLRCRDCEYIGSNYEKNGQPRLTPSPTKGEE